jgi:hypothetical protein
MNLEPKNAVFCANLLEIKDAMKKNKSFNPMRIGLLGSAAVMLEADIGDIVVHKFRRMERCRFFWRGWGFHAQNSE